MRKKLTHRRIILPDKRYDSITFHKLINNVMKEGNKYTAENLCYGAMTQLAKKFDKDPKDIWKQICTNVTPTKSTIKRKIGGGNYSIPIDIKPEKGAYLSPKIIASCARTIKKNSKQPFMEILTKVLDDAYNNTGAAIEFKNRLHKTAEDNQAFSSYRW